MSTKPATTLGTTNPSIEHRLIEAGKQLKFLVKEQVGASESAWVDLVWFDDRLPLPDKSFHMRYELLLPVIGFEIEHHTGLNAKHVKGSVSNLSNLGAQLGVIVIGQPNLDALQAQPAWQGKGEACVKQELRDRTYRWVYAEAQPRVRIIVMFEREVEQWIEKLQVATTAKAAAV
jgi:hypothetical protein